jgi:hypothetical protein
VLARALSSPLSLTRPITSITPVLLQRKYVSPRFMALLSCFPLIAVQSKIAYGGGEVDLELFEAPDTGLFPDPSRQALYKDMDAVMIVFNMLNRPSFENARNRV